MAATRLIAMHKKPNQSMTKCIKERTDYAKNGDKTENGELVTSYACTVDLVEQEFAASKKDYLKQTGRTYEGDIIAYQIRQSFKPGEITPKEANEVGYETAMRFTKGRHAFIVATHVDRAHIHNHIIFNSTNLDCDGKFKDAWYVALTLQKVSDLVCLEHALSIITPKKSGERDGRSKFPKRVTVRDQIRKDIDEALAENPADFDEFLRQLRDRKYEIKTGKNISVRGPGQKRYVRFSSLGEDYSEKILRGKCKSAERSAGSTSRKKRDFDLLIDINRKMSEGKSKGYANWASRYNVKQVAAALLFLQEHDIRDLDSLNAITADKTQRYHQTADSIKDIDKRLREISELEKQIISFVKTRETFEKYKSARYSKKFFEEHREEITMHRAAKAYFTQHNLKKLPRINDLKNEYRQLVAEKKNLYKQYHPAKDEMMQYQIAKRNIEQILQIRDETEIEQQKKQNKDNMR